MTGLMFMFYILGILTALGFMLLFRINKKFSISWRTWIAGGTAILLAVFAAAWFFSSLFEGENQAAGLGLVFFGIPSIILMFVTRRLVLKKSE